MKFDDNFFDEEFYRSTLKAPTGYGLKGAKRDENSPNYVEFSSKLKDCFPKPFEFLSSNEVRQLSVLDIGGGMGWRTRNHVENGFDAFTCDISRWAFENSVMPKGKHFCKDIRDVASIDRDFDVVIVERIVEYLPPDQMGVAMAAAWSRVKPGGYMVTSVICSDHADQTLVWLSRPGRLNICPRDVWFEVFFDLGMKIDDHKTKIFQQNNWDCIWVWRKT